jgi:hypothetical protein
MMVFERVDPARVVWYIGILVLACLELDRTDEAERHIRIHESRVGALAASALPARCSGSRMSSSATASELPVVSVC